MFGNAAYAALKQTLARQEQMPDGIERWEWFLVPSKVGVVEIPVAKTGGLVDAAGNPAGRRPGELEKVRIALRHTVRMQIPYVNAVRFGFDEDLEVVIWALL